MASACRADRSNTARPTLAIGTTTPTLHLAATVSADQQHELPTYVALLAHPVHFGNLREREGMHDREREAPGLDQLADSAQGVDRAAPPRRRAASV
jgi:hypothetical protein